MLINICKMLTATTAVHKRVLVCVNVCVCVCVCVCVLQQDMIKNSMFTPKAPR